MAVGRFICVALPLILIIASAVAVLVAVLAGVAHDDLKLFTLDLKDLSINKADLENIADSLDLDFGDLSDLGNLGDDLKDLGSRADDITITAKTLGLADTYDITLWGYCKQSEGGKRTCTDAKFNWANDALDPKKIEEYSSIGDVKINLPDEIDSALKTFRIVIKWAEIAFIISLVALAVEFIVGIFSNFSRGISCLTWLIASLTAVVVCASAALATATSAIVVGAVESTAKFYGVNGTIDTGFLAAIWIGAALSIAAATFWIFTICCCKPESRSSRKSKKHHSSDGEKLLGAAYSPRGYAPLDNEHEMTGGAHYNAPPQFDQGSFAEHHKAPSYPSGTATRSDLAYEPYSHRA